MCFERCLLYTSKPISPEKKFKELVGHTPLQVVCGAVLGIAVGCALMQI